MKKMITAMVVASFGILFAAHFLNAENDQTARFFNDCIDRKIEQCEQKASLADSRSACIKECAETSQKQVSFYKANRQRLVKEMQAENMDLSEQQVNHFLIKAYFDVTAVGPIAQE